MKLLLLFLAITCQVAFSGLVLSQTPQVNNSGFENWETSTSEIAEPLEWNSFKTASGTWSGFGGQQLNKSTQKRPGSTGNFSAVIWVKSILGVAANGNLTTGQINMGSTTPSSSSNYNVTHTAQTAFSEALGAHPDSIVVWVRSKISNAANQPRIHAVIHDTYDVHDPADAGSASHIVADAALNFTTTGNVWVRKSIPFIYAGPATSPNFILVNFTTCKDPGVGTAGDSLYIDDIQLIYNPVLSTGTISPLNYYVSSTQSTSVSIPFTLIGNMDPGNIVTAQLSNAAGSFASPITLGTLTTTISGSINGTIPAGNATGSGYRIRVVSSNIAMTAADNGSNIQIYNVISNISPSSPQNICQNSSGTNLTITENPAGTSREWKFATTPGGPYSSFSPGQLNSIYTPVFQNSGTYYVICQSLIGGLTVNSNEVVIIVTPNILPTFAAVPAICSGTTLAPLPTTSLNGITGTWSPALSNTATTTYTFTPNSGLCAITTTLSITVNPNITPTFTAVPAICSGSTLAPLPTTSTNGITGTWLPTLNNSATTTYTFTPTAGLCATTTTLTITVNPNVIPTFNPVGAICSGAALAPLPTTSLNGITGTWTPVLNNSATTTYTFTPMTGLCATTTTLTITVNPNITPTFNSVAAICSGATLAPLPTTSTNGITGTWLPALNNTATTIYTFTPTTGQCATTTTLTITVNTNATPNFAAVPAICSGATLSPLPTTSINGIAGTWSPALNNTATTTYTYTPTTGQCATATTMTITVNPIVTPTFNPVAAICSGTNLAPLSTTSTNGITGTWLPALNNTTTTTYTFTPITGQCATTTTLTITVNPNVIPTFTAVPAICSGATLATLPYTSLNSIAGVWTPTLNNTATTTYTFTPTAGLCANSTTLTITVNPTDNPAFDYSPSTLCQTGPDPSANITGGATGTFTASPAGLVFLNNITGQIDVSASSIDTYTITFTTNGVCPSSTNASVTITNAPLATFSYSGPYCANGINPLPIFASGASAGVFSSTPGLVFISTTTGQVDLSASAPGTYDVTNSIAAAGGCSAVSSTNSITINATITPAFTAVAPICSGATLDALPTTSNNGITGTWLPALDNTTTTTYTFTPTVGQCASTTSLMITVDPLVTPTFTAVAPICSGASLMALPTTSIDGITGSWSPAMDNTFTTTYTFTPTSGQCAATTSLTISVNTLITPSFTTIDPLCQNSQAPVLPLTSTNVINGSWMPDTINTAVSGATVYTFTPDTGVCATTADITITINPMPATPIITLNGLVLQSDAIAGNQWYDQNGLINGETNQSYAPAIEGDYFAIVTLNGCSSNASNTINVVFTGIESAENNRIIKVYPNPVTDELIVEIAGNKETIGYKIYNSIGQVVFNGNVQEKTIINTSNMLTGVYLMKLENGKTFELKKIIKE